MELSSSSRAHCSSTCSERFVSLCSSVADRNVFFFSQLKDMEQEGEARRDDTECNGDINCVSSNCVNSNSSSCSILLDAFVSLSRESSNESAGTISIDFTWSTATAEFTVCSSSTMVGVAVADITAESSESESSR